MTHMKSFDASTRLQTKKLRGRYYST